MRHRHIKRLSLCFSALAALLLLALPRSASAACATACAAGRYCSSATSTCVICTLGFTCAGGLTAQPVPCVPFSACPATGLSAQQPCAWGAVTYVGSGAAGSTDSWWTSATLDAPAGVATWPNTLNGIVMVSSGNYIRNATGSRVYTLAGTGTAAALSAPTRMAVSSGTPLYVADTGNNALKSIACA
jgi:hypothetical protein